MMESTTTQNMRSILNIDEFEAVDICCVCCEFNKWHGIPHVSNSRRNMLPDAFKYVFHIRSNASIFSFTPENNEMEMNMNEKNKIRNSFLSFS